MKIPPELREMFKLIAKRRTYLGYTEDEVARSVLRMGFDAMIKDTFITKLIEQQKLLERPPAA